MFGSPKIRKISPLYSCCICFLYAISSNTWSVAGGMNQARLSHTSTLLANGKVLVAGGYAHVASEPIVLSSAELYTQ